MSIEKAQALIELGRHEEAITRLRELLATNPYDSEVLLYLGFAQLFHGDYAGGLETSDLALSVDYQRLGLHGLRGACLSHLGRASEALDAYDSALELDPNSIGARVQYVEAIFADRVTRTDKVYLAKAVELRNQLLEIAPDLRETHHIDAQLKYVLGQPKPAEAAVRRALKADPNSAESLELLAVIQKGQGKLSEAGDSYVAAGRANPRAANTGGLESLGKVVAPIGLGAIVIFRLARTSGRGADAAGASAGIVVLVIVAALFIGFLVYNAHQTKPTATKTDYSHLSKDAQSVIKESKNLGSS